MNIIFKNKKIKIDTKDLELALNAFSSIDYNINDLIDSVISEYNLDHSDETFYTLKELVLKSA